MEVDMNGFGGDRSPLEMAGVEMTGKVESCRT